MDQYEVSKQIGRGNFGTVSLVTSAADGKRYVMKMISLDELTKSERQAALQEMKLLKRLRHPFIVSYRSFSTNHPAPAQCTNDPLSGFMFRESFLENNTLHIAMHYCEGGDLNTFIKKRAETGEYFSEEEILDWFVQLALALQYCHHRKIIHRSSFRLFTFQTSSHTHFGIDWNSAS